jgi:uncharacterized protein
MGRAMVRIPSEAGGSLEAIYDEPARGNGSSGARGAVIVCHAHPAFGGRMDTPLIGALARGFVSAGLPALRFHFRGIEGSDGTATGGLVEQADVVAAHRFLVGRGVERIAWVGYSFGALMALRAVAEGTRPAAYVGVAIPTTIIGEDPIRSADVARAISMGVPTLFYAGAEDPLCEVPRLRAWCEGAAHATVEALAAEPHSFSIVGMGTVVRRAVAFVPQALAS